MRALVTLCAALTAAIACSAPGHAPLAPAGTQGDDGAGVLARASAQLTLAGATDDEGEPYPDEDRYERTYDYDPLSYAGFGYGNFGYGGFGYGAFAYGGMGGFAFGGGGIGYGRGYDRGGTGYDPRSAGDPGAVEGALVWKSDAGVAWPADCPLARVARAGAPVAGAVVYLDRVASGRAFERTGGVLTATACGLAPSVQLVAPVPADVIVDNAAPRAARLSLGTGVARDSADLDPGGRLALPVDRPGIVAVDLAGGAPAWVVGQAHPYYAVTDAAGRFALDLVPHGTHTLVIWSPPVVTAVTPDGPRWSAPTIERRTIVVPRQGVATIQTSLSPAP